MSWLFVRILACFLCVFPIIARGELGVALISEHPMAGEQVFIHVKSDSGVTCLPPMAIMSGNGSQLIAKLYVTDICSPQDYVVDRQYSIGAFSSGIYALNVEYCVVGPRGEDCGSIGTLNFSVADNKIQVSVPIDFSNGFSGFFILLNFIFVIILLALRNIR